MHDKGFGATTTRIAQERATTVPTTGRAGALPNRCEPLFDRPERQTPNQLLLGEPSEHHNRSDSKEGGR